MSLYAKLADDAGSDMELTTLGVADHDHGQDHTPRSSGHPSPRPSPAFAHTDAVVEVDDDNPGVDLLPGPATSRWARQPHLDRFFNRVYLFYRGKGLVNIALAQLFDHLTVVWLAMLIIFLSACVDYRALYRRLKAEPCPNGDLDTADLTSTDCHGNLPISVARVSSMSAGAWVVVGLFFGVWIWRLGSFILSVPELLDMQSFYHEALDISNRELQTIAWSEVMDKLVEAQKIHHMCTTKLELSHLDICNLIMRRMNFMIALANEPFFERAITIRKKIFMPKSLQWNLHRCFRGVVFRERGVTKELKDPSKHSDLVRSLIISFKLAGLLSFVLSPLLLIYRLADFCFRNSEELRKSPGAMATRQWTPYARWKLRSYNEVEHYFVRRLNRSYEPSVKYVNMFTSETLAIVGRFFTFVFGGFVIVFLAVSVAYDEEFLLADLTASRSVGWWLGMCGVVLAISRSLIPSENMVFDPKTQMFLIRQHTLYNPDHWFGREKSLDTLDEFTELFQFKLLIFLEELFSVFITPYLLYFRFPKIADKLVLFFRSNSVDRNGIGDVCRVATFNYVAGDGGDDAGQDDIPGATSNTGAAFFEESSIARERAVRNKMEQSLIAFKTHHPRWKEETPSLLNRFGLVDWAEEDEPKLHESLFQESIEGISGSGYTPPVLRKTPGHAATAGPVSGPSEPLVGFSGPSNRRRGWTGGVNDVDV